jgi:hypothetical protein
MRGLTLTHLEFDEQHTWIFKKRSRLTINERRERYDIGEVYLWTVVDQKTKLLPVFLIGKGGHRLSDSGVDGTGPIRFIAARVANCSHGPVVVIQTRLRGELSDLGAADSQPTPLPQRDLRSVLFPARRDDSMPAAARGHAKKNPLRPLSQRYTAVSTERFRPIERTVRMFRQ